MVYSLQQLLIPSARLPQENRRRSSCIISWKLFMALPNIITISDQYCFLLPPFNKMCFWRKWNLKIFSIWNIFLFLGSLARCLPVKRTSTPPPPPPTPRGCPENWVSFWKKLKWLQTRSVMTRSPQQLKVIGSLQRWFLTDSVW